MEEEAIKKSGEVIAGILNVLLERGIRHSSLDFSDLQLSDDHLPFFIQSARWLSDEGLIRASNIIGDLSPAGAGVVTNPVLTSRGFEALGKKIIFAGNSADVADVAKRVSRGEGSYWQVADFLGALAGGFSKSLGS